MIQPFISDRYSPFAFSDAPVEQEKIFDLFEAARWAPSSFNEQPWRFIFATREDPEAYDRMINLLTDANKAWAMTAPVVGLSIAKKNFTYNGKSNFYAQYDTGQAMGSLLAQATYMGLRIHQMGGYDSARAQSDLNIPEDYQPMAMFVIGYPGEVSRLPEDLQKREKRERTRHQQEDFVFKNLFQAK